MIKVKMNAPSKVERRLKIQPYGPLHKFMANEAMKRMNARYVPEKSTTLWKTAYVEPSDCSIHYDQIYAGYQYYGMRKDGTHVVSHYTKAGTGPYWDKKMMSAEGNSLRKTLDKALKSGRF